MSHYLRATRHPWVCLLFLLPLLLAYEGGVLWLGGDRAADLRNGADAWLRWGLERYGVGGLFAAPLLVVAVLLVWSWWRWADRPDDPTTAFFGMAFESGLFAFALWQFSRNFGPIIDALGVRLQIGGHAAPMGQILTYVGAGIYEEVLFRLGLFAGAWRLLAALGLPTGVAGLAAAASSSLAFSAAHHVGPGGEPMQPYVFLFRVLLGLYFAALYAWRGFGIAVGAHAGYDVLVGVAVG